MKKKIITTLFTTTVTLGIGAFITNSSTFAYENKINSSTATTNSYYYFKDYFKKNPPKKIGYRIIKNIPLNLSGNQLYGIYKTLVIRKYGKIYPNRTYRFLFDNKIDQRHIYSYSGIKINIRLIG